jgi:transposase
LDTNDWGVFMSKYDFGFKERVVRDYRSGKFGGYRGVGLRHEVSEYRVRSWVRAYGAHGVDGLKKKFGHYDVRFKLAVLRRMREEGLSYQQTATLFDLRGGTGVVSGWVRRYDLGGALGLESKRKGRPPMKRRATPKAKRPAPSTYKSLSREELLVELEYVSAERDFLKKLDALMKEEEEAEAQKLLHENKS